MAKTIKAIVKLQLPAGEATPQPPVGPALGPHQVNTMEFVKKFNEITAKMEKGMILPVVITIYTDKTFSFEVKAPSTSYLLKKAASIAKGSGDPRRNKVGKISEKQLIDIAKVKLTDLNCYSLEKAVEIIKGSAKSMGLEITNE
ncbi:MAG: 50S ribosomal protein L11 [Acidobacteriota bacterium]